jgi:hypothetical protein
MKHPTSRTSGHSHGQVMAKADLEGLLPVVPELMVCLMVREEEGWDRSALKRLALPLIK